LRRAIYPQSSDSLGIGQLGRKPGVAVSRYVAETVPGYPAFRRVSGTLGIAAGFYRNPVSREARIPVRKGVILPMKEILGEVAQRTPNRRGLLKTLGIAGAGAGAAVFSGAQFALGAPAITDLDILNFALNLEYLEAEFYSVATRGMTIEQLGIPISGSGRPGATTGGGQIHFGSEPFRLGQVAFEIGHNERVHVRLLRDAITQFGGTPVAKPAINLDALGAFAGNLDAYLALSRAFEDTGVSAYGGAAPLIQDKTVLGYAARILAAEAEHVGLVRLQVAMRGVKTQALDSLDILPPPSGDKYFSIEYFKGLTAVRTPQQVLAIVYAMADATAGGFFPNGVNGVINMSGAPA
jgi:hypothetical protein